MLLLLALIGVGAYFFYKRRLCRDRVGSLMYRSPLTKIMSDQENGFSRVPEFSQGSQGNFQEQKRANLARKTSSTRSKRIQLGIFPARVAEMHKDHEFMFQGEFEKLDELSPSLPSDRSTLMAMHEDNVGKNRFVDILPFENNHKVKLLDGGPEYINASYIDGYTRPKEYIATQGPMGVEDEQNGRRRATVTDFWRMIWQEKVQCIVMLTKCIELFKVKCTQYWPNEVEDTENFGSITIQLTSETDRDSYTVRTFKLQKSDSDIDEAPRTVTHWYYPHWPDMKQTEEENLLSFIETVRNSGSISKNVPTVIHCSAGVGRTGSYIALDLLLQQMRDHDFVDVFGCVYALRTQRVRMVQTLDQYILLYDCLNIKIKQKLEEAETESREDGYPHLYENIGFNRNEERFNQVSRERNYANSDHFEDIPLEQLDLRSSISSNTVEGSDKEDEDASIRRLTFGIPKTKPLNNQIAKSKGDVVRNSKDMIERNKPIKTLETKREKSMNN